VARLKAELDRRINPLSAAPTWISATLTSGWSNQSGFQVAQYTKDPSGFVVLRGVVTGGSTGSTATILTLPVGFRPAANERFATVSGAGTATLEIQTDGRVVPFTATTTQISLWRKVVAGMRAVSKVDAQGNFLEDVLVEEDAPIPAGCVSARPPEGFYSPKWTGSTWVEGKPEAEILEAARVTKIDSFAGKAVDDLRPYVTGEHGDREMLFIVAKHVKALF
jgi:hypothetical protein